MNVWNRNQRLQQIQQLNPITDHSLICRLVAGYEFPWDVTHALELAMVKTFCVPSISRLLTRTGEFHQHTQKRYDDTGLLIAEILQWGYDSERGAASIRRMNAIHGHYPISNDDFLYILSTFIYEPIRWNERFGWRLFCEQEKLAIFYFWQAVGERMQIRDIPSTYEEFAHYNQKYEQENFVYSDSNRAVGESTINLFLSWFPALSHPLLKPAIYSLFDERMLAAFGFAKPSTVMVSSVENSLKLRGYLQRWLVPRRRSDFFTESQLKSYPRGYQLRDIAPSWMLDKLE
ncbi:oxygenase MpaB family protein [Coleofasciculus sp. E2-BRE-01]|uniref:oxygenase MpaB family protein n=1 Tax=Coleofasciculus sp. E2-BRE-01 TaxID=3069524 RepID=UPI0032F26529